MKGLRTAKRWVRSAKRKVMPLRFANDPANLVIKSPRTIAGARRIRLGNDVFIGENSEIRAVEEARTVRKNPHGEDERERFEPRIEIGDRVWATSSLHLAAYCEIIIEDDVMLASNIFISDGLHGYENAHVPYMYQKRTRVCPIRIGRGSWIGQNVVVMPGVVIGEMCIIGANSVVTKSVPRRSIAVGSPARVIKRWDGDAGDWKAVDGEAPRGPGDSEGMAAERT
jgi:acetyltransferase-like isoleucine patch superfamily enzyme